jgi:hypothetical protein
VNDFGPRLQGNLYGTTTNGGTANASVIFKVDSSDHGTVLNSFRGGDDGGNPYVGVTLGAQARLYGTTAFGGGWSSRYSHRRERQRLGPEP